MFKKHASCVLTGEDEPPSIRLTHNHEDKEDGGQPRSDVEHEPDMVPQFNHIIHVRHQHRWKEEPDGAAQLKYTPEESEGKYGRTLNSSGSNTEPGIKVLKLYVNLF